jgi:hypothetical protein
VSGVGNFGASLRLRSECCVYNMSLESSYAHPDPNPNLSNPVIFLKHLPSLPLTRWMTRIKFSGSLSVLMLFSGVAFTSYSLQVELVHILIDFSYSRSSTFSPTNCSWCWWEERGRGVMVDDVPSHEEVRPDGIISHVLVNFESLRQWRAVRVGCGRRNSSALRVAGPRWKSTILIPTNTPYYYHYPQYWLWEMINIPYWAWGVRFTEAETTSWNLSLA